MKVGDLVRVNDTAFGHGNPSPSPRECDCFICISGSNGIGVIVGPGQHNAWQVMFDTGMHDTFEEELDILNRSAYEANSENRGLSKMS